MSYTRHGPKHSYGEKINCAVCLSARLFGVHFELLLFCESPLAENKMLKEEWMMAVYLRT